MQCREMRTRMWGTPGSRISGRWSSLSHGRNSALSGLRVCPGRSSRGLREESPNPELLQLQIQISAPDLARPVEKALPTPGINKATHARILTGLAGVLHPRDGSPFSRGWVEKPGEPGSLGSPQPRHQSRTNHPSTGPPSGRWGSPPKKQRWGQTNIICNHFPQSSFWKPMLSVA